MGEGSEIQTLAVAVGEIRGQMRELIHTVNNTGAKVDALGEKVSPLNGLVSDMSALSERVAANDRRLTQLEHEQQRREGASNVLLTIVKSPAFGWLAGGATLIWAALSGHFK